MHTIPQESHERAEHRLLQSSLTDEISFLLARANAVSVAAGGVALAPHELKVRSYSVLALAAADARPSQRELAEFLRLDPSQVVALVDELQSKGLVERAPDPRDRRANVVMATAAGRRVHEAASAAARKAEASVYASLTAEQKQQLEALLRHIAFPR